MIQRMQTVWLLLATVSAFLTCKLSFFSGNIIGDDKIKVFSQLTASFNLILLVLTVILGSVSFLAIFLYKNRKLQLRITLAAILLSIVIPILYYMQAQKFVEGTYSITAVISILIPVLLILAARGINSDQKLVKSLDRLR
ncbi:MAG: DUF4293 domain-containing protein [Bacteroidota bacterium]